MTNSPYFIVLYSSKSSTPSSQATILPSDYLSNQNLPPFKLPAGPLASSSVPPPAQFTFKFPLSPTKRAAHTYTPLHHPQQLEFRLQHPPNPIYSSADMPHHYPSPPSQSSYGHYPYHTAVPPSQYTNTIYTRACHIHPHTLESSHFRRQPQFTHPPSNYNHNFTPI